MDDMISRAAAISEINEYFQGLDLCISEPDLKLDGYKNGLQVAIQELKRLPTIDAIPVEWLEEHDSWGNEYGRWYITVVEALSMWQKEQEAQDED